MNDGWSEFYTEEDIAKIHVIELRSLDVLKDVCEKLNIHYFMYGGSLLGTIKYEGFVPWDDDLDLAMIRKDYEKLIDEGPGLLPPEYEIQHPRVTKKSPYNYIKFRRKDTTLTEYKNHKLKINHGVYFDIYPIDSIPDNYLDYLKLKLEYDKWVAIFQARQNYRIDHKVVSIKDRVWMTIRLIQSAVAHVFSVSYLINKIDSISTRYNQLETLNQGNLTYPKPVNYFNGINLEEASFEGRKVNIPSGYRINLKNRYGDIKRLPPSSKRVGHKPYILDLGDYHAD